MTLVMSYKYRIYPDTLQEQMMLDWLEISRQVYNYALREIKDWVNSRKCSLDYCSTESEYIILKVAKFHNHIANVLKDWQFKLANHLCTKVGIGMVFVEDLNPKAMGRGMLRKHTLDAAFGQFLNLLEWVARKYQVFFARVNPDGTSQTCPKCNTHTGKKSLSYECINVMFVGTKHIEIMPHQK